MLETAEMIDRRRKISCTHRQLPLAEASEALQYALSLQTEKPTGM